MPRTRAAATAPEAATSARAIEAVRALARLSRVLERATTELSLAHYRVLAAVGAGADRASWVASRLSLGRPTVSASVDALLQRGLLARSGAGEDGRVSTLALTAAGREMLDRTERLFVQRINELCARTGDADGVINALVMLGAAQDEEVSERDRLEAERSRPPSG